MPVGFKIASIEYGWFTMWIGPNGVADVSNYLGYDLPRELLRKVWNVLQEDEKEEWLYLMDEPHGYIMQILHENGKIHLAEYELMKTCHHLNHREENEKENIGDCTFRSDWEAEKFVDALVSEFYIYENGNGRNLYETHWMPFPDEEYEKLKNLAFEMDKKMPKYEKMYCVDTMCPQRLNERLDSF